MINQVIDIWTGERKTYAPEVKCVGGQQQLYFEVSMAGMQPAHIEQILKMDFQDVRIIDQRVLGMTAGTTNDNKLRFCLVFPVGTVNLNEPQTVINLCNMLQGVIARRVLGKL